MNFNYEQIEQYIDGKLTGEALDDFEAQLMTDQALAEEVALYKDVGETLTTDYAYKKEDAELGQLFNQLGKKYFNEEVATLQETDTAKVKQDNTKVIPLQPQTEKSEKTSGGKIRWLRPVIALAIAAMIALLIWQPWQSSLYAPYKLDVIEMSNGEQALIQAQKDYNSGKYTEALSVFEKYPDNIPVQLAKGNAEYNVGKLDAAVATFLPIASGNSTYKSTANWYLALTYIELNQPEKAKATLNQIKSGEYYDRAQRQLKKMK